jgi:two-component system, NtrC family, sensor kinase
MKTTLMKIIILSVLLFTGIILSQTNDTTYINGDTLNAGNVQIFNNWDYHSGDDSIWALPTFSSIGWDTVDCRLDIDSMKAFRWNGIGWFRKTIKIDSTLLNKIVAMTLNHYGASQFYINGKLINTFGKVSKNSEAEEIYYSNSEPVIINFDSSSTYLLAVRYSNHLPINYQYLYPRFRSTAGFYVTFKSLSEAENYYGVTQANSTTSAAFMCAIFLSISVIYFLLYLFYSNNKEYLYYAFFTFSFSYLFASSALSNILHSEVTYFFIDSIISRFFVLAIFVSILAFLYQIFYGRLLKIFRYVLLIGITVYILQFYTVFEKISGYMFVLIVGFTSIEILRVIFLAIKHKRNNAWVIGAGVCVFACGIIIVFVINILFGKANLNNLYGLVFLFSIPLSMSIYLARSSSQTNKNLETQLATVKKLSEEAIEQEKTAAKLAIETEQVKAENEKKTQELEHANEIEKAYTELKSTQAQLIHSEKMASLGELTAGIAHEIKNPLNFVNNFSEVSTDLIKEMLEEADKGNTEEVKKIAKDLEQNLEKINQHGRRADSIVKGMLLHSRGTSGEKTLTDINDLLEQYVNLAYHGLRAQNKEFNITIEKDYAETLEKINVVPQDISRVFLNIINNAWYAAYDRKKKSGNDFSPILKVSTKNLKDKVEIRIGDNGNGIPKDILDKIFQPFFTTKPTGEGTGLGLSLSYDIVTKQHGGELKVETKENEGTVFIIILPK